MGEENDEKSALVPRRRFPEFREAEGWKQETLSGVATVVMGSSPKSDGYNETKNGLPLLQGNADIKNRLSAPRVFTSEITKECQVGDILMSVRAPVGSVAKSIHHACIGRGIAAIHAKKPNVQELLYQWLLSYEPRWVDISQGGTFDAINSDDLKQVGLTIPSPAEQQKIADCLSSLDELITAETQKLGALKTHKKGLMQQLFPREGETVPRLRFPEFREAGEWEEKPLAEVCNVLQGYGFPEVLQGRSEGKYPFCKVSDISRAVAEAGGLLTTAANYVDDADTLTLRAKPVPKGATVFAKIGEALRLNRRAFVKRECLIDNNAVGLKAIHGVADDYFVYLLSQLIDLNKHCGGAVPSVNKSTLEEIAVVVPSPDEQKRIAESLLSLDNLITAQSQKIDALKTHKQGLMQQLFPVLDEAPA